MAVGDPTEPDELRRKPQLSRLPDRRNNQASRGGCHPFAKFAGTIRKLLAVCLLSSERKNSDWHIISPHASLQSGVQQTCRNSIFISM